MEGLTVSVNPSGGKSNIREARNINLEGHFIVPHPQNRRFVGRYREFEKLRRLFSSLDGNSHYSVAIFGLGGVGKSQVASEFAYRYKSKYSSVFWVNGSSRQKLVNDYVGIASKMLNTSVADKYPEGIAKALKIWLDSEEAAAHKWLLIVDGADNINKIQDLLPQAGHLLVTTRDQLAVGSVLYDGVEIEQMGLEEATDLFRRSVDVDEEDWDAEKLGLALNIVKELGYLPLAIEQSAAYIRETRCSLAKYLELWKTSRIALLDRPSKRRPNFSHENGRTIATTWTVSFQKLAIESSTAADLLFLFAFLDCESIPETLIKNGLAKIGERCPSLAALVKNEVLYDEAICALNSFSLISRRPDTDRIQVHILVGHVIHEWLQGSSGPHWASCAIEVLWHIFPERTARCHSTEATRRTLISHVNTCLEHLERYELTLGDELALFNNAGSFLYEMGEYNEAMKCFKTVIANVEAVRGRQNQNEIVIEALVNISVVYQRIGLWDDAQKTGNEALAAVERLFGPTHMACVRPLRMLGRTLKWKGERQRAKVHFDRAMKIVHESDIIDPEGHLSHIGIALSKECCYEAKWTEAHSLLSQALQFSESQRDVQFKAKVLKTLGRYWYYQGEWEESRKVVDEALKLREVYFGLDTPDTASLLGCLGSVSIHENHYARAESSFEKAVQLQQHTPWERDYGIVHHLCGLGCAVAKQGRLTEAKGHYHRALKLQEKWQGGNPSVEAWILNSLGAICAMEGSFQAAEKFLNSTLNIRRRAYGLSDPETQDVIRQLIALHQVSGGYPKAKEFSHLLVPEPPISRNFNGAQFIIRCFLMITGVFPAEAFLSDGMDTSMKQKVVVHYESFRSMRRWVIFPLWKLTYHSQAAHVCIFIFGFFIFLHSILKYMSV